MPPMLYGLDATRGRLDGQVGLVTGGGRGIGAAIAHELAEAGMRIAVAVRTEAQIRAVAGAIGGLGLVGDVSRQGDVEAWVAETERRLGPIDLLVNNAAIVGAPEPFWEHPPSEWWRVFEVNVLRAFLCCTPRLIRGLAGGGADALSGRYLHAEDDADLDALAARADEIRQHNLNAIRLRR